MPFRDRGCVKGSVRYHRLFASNPKKVSVNWIGVFLIIDYVD